MQCGVESNSGGPLGISTNGDGMRHDNHSGEDRGNVSGARRGGPKHVMVACLVLAVSENDNFHSGSGSCRPLGST